MRAALPHTELKVDREGVALNCEIYGEGKHTILFIPTWAIIHSRSWKAQVPYFSEHFRVITYDPRGNGKSSRPDTPDGYAIDLVIADVIAVLDATGTEKAVLVGHSLSSAIAFAVAANMPERVSAVVSICGCTPIVAPYKERASAYEEKLVDNPQGWQKYNPDYWEKDYPDFVDFFLNRVHSEPHSTKQHEDAVSWALEGDGTMLRMTQDARDSTCKIDEDMYRKVQCPSLIVVGDADAVTPTAGSRRIAELTGGELQIFNDGGHAVHTRFPGKFNTLMRDFLARHLGTWKPEQQKPAKRQKRVLYLSSPIGLGHARRDLAVARELRDLCPGTQVDWLAQDPVTRLLAANKETIHPDSVKLANESSHIEEESGEHDLNAFQAIRRMDEILVKNFMIFQEAVEQDHYDLVIADEAWDVDHYWHEHPELKKAQIAWMTDFVGWVPMPENGDREAFLTTDYNAEMIGHIETHPGLRDRAIFVGNADDIVPLGFGENLPQMRDWVPKHFDFSGYIIGQHPCRFGDRQELRKQFGYGDDEQVCIVTVGGSGVGGALVQRILDAYPTAKEKLPALRMIVVAGPRLNTSKMNIPTGVEVHAFVPDLDRHLAVCDLALVQGGLTTCMELTAAGTPFLYFPLRNHFEQNFHVAHRLERYGAGRKMIFDESPPEVIAEAMVEELSGTPVFKPVEKDGATRAAKMLAEML